ncbi:D-lactaldehyde dehydrogenase [Auriculariales sp. MPI-PUGE-AT-0066]|nr:D-lactaldehyde dehydrogenase [Auriculariales sp. MPI-PUGE-AT-0066]
MPAVSAPAKVLVTGCSGFLGSHVPAAFDKAVLGVDAVVHVASPMIMAGPEDPPEKLITPAVEGTLSLLRSIEAYGSGVKRIVVTSSMASVMEPHEGPYEYTEDDWNNAVIKLVEKLGKAATPMDKYRASKTHAERALWNYMEVNKSKLRFEAVTVNPPFIYGPVIHEVPSKAQLPGSAQYLLYQLTRADVSNPEIAASFLANHIDVRDVAEVHVDAIEREEVAGHRLLIGCGPLALQDLLDAANALLADGSVTELSLKIAVGVPGAANPVRKDFATITPRSQELLGRKFIQLPEMLRDTLLSFKNKNLV